MPLVSWAFEHEEHAVRFEVWWRWSGWSRQRLFVDHDLAQERRGYFKLGSPLSGQIPQQGGSTAGIVASARRERFSGTIKAQLLVNSAEVQGRLPIALERKPEHSEEDDGTLGVSYGLAFSILLWLPLLAL